MSNRIRKYVRLRERNQITLPAELLEGLAVEIGGFLEISRGADNSIQLRPTALVVMNAEHLNEQEKAALEPAAMEQAKSITTPEQFIKRVQDSEKKKRKTKVAQAIAAAHAAAAISRG
ncbi:MAG TPA: hypothetical protein VKW78_06810 [Terriglobales bacterium]|nr:hypothetical protein [Terriglobales bacterium]